jgi:hypothetical protein
MKRSSEETILNDILNVAAISCSVHLGRVRQNSSAAHGWNVPGTAALTEPASLARGRRLIERPEWVEIGLAATERAIVGTGHSATRHSATSRLFPFWLSGGLAFRAATFQSNRVST